MLFLQIRNDDIVLSRNLPLQLVFSLCADYNPSHMFASMLDPVYCLECFYTGRCFRLLNCKQFYVCEFEIFTYFLCLEPINFTWMIVGLLVPV